MTTAAKNIIAPTHSTDLRVVFLYVGQGDATLLVIPDGLGRFRYVLVDINHGEAQGGLDVVALLEDLLPKNEDGRSILDLFVNTHPHRDHLGGLAELRKRVVVREVWHSGFEPSDQHEAQYQELLGLIADVSSAGGTVVELRGTRSATQFGAATVNVLAPADHAKEEIRRLSGEERDRRIHDFCAVLRFGYGEPMRYLLLTGDAERRAFEENILGPTEYHKERMSAALLHASHHGSRGFFKTDKDDDDPYTRHIELIRPTWVIVSAPKQADSPHGHPHDDAMELYREFVADPDDVKVLGNRPECLIWTVTETGQQQLASDNGVLVDAYPLASAKASASIRVGGTGILSSLDRGRPMG